MLVLKVYVYVSPCGKRHLWASRIQVQPVQPVMLAIRNKALWRHSNSQGTPKYPRSAPLPNHAAGPAKLLSFSSHFLDGKEV